MVVKWRKIRGNKWVPEDRLKACIPGALFLVPLSMLGFALALRFVDGTPGLVLCLLCFLMNGLGVRVCPRTPEILSNAFTRSTSS